MSKLKAFLVPIDRTQKNTGEIIKYLGTYANSDFNGQLHISTIITNSKYFQAMQLVVCDMDSHVDSGALPYWHPIGEYIATAKSKNELSIMQEPSASWVKIIASHPQIPNTAPLPESFIREYVKCQGACTIQYVKEEMYDLPFSRTEHDKDNNPLLRIVPTTTVIDEETGENVLKGRRISADMLNGLDKAVNVWSDEDIVSAFIAGTNSIGIDTNLTRAINWLKDLKKFKK